MVGRRFGGLSEPVAGGGSGYRGGGSRPVVSCRSCLEEDLPHDGAAGQPGVRLSRLAEGKAPGDARAESSGPDLVEDDADGDGPLTLAGQVVTSGDPAQGQRAR